MADIRRGGSSLAEPLVQGGYSAKSTLSIVFFADGGGDVQLIRQNWLPARIELQEPQIKFRSGGECDSPGQMPYNLIPEAQKQPSPGQRLTVGDEV